jgi:DNA-binding MarR family transcriptional regulator
VTGPELFRLGRRLMKLGVLAMPAGGFRDLPISVRIVLVDVFEHPGTTKGQIVERTGFPQSHVSQAVARLRDGGVLETSIDRDDRRRTLVSPAPDHVARIDHSRPELGPIDGVLEAALVARLGPPGAGHLAEATAALELLAELLVPAAAREPVAAEPRA